MNNEYTSCVNIARRACVCVATRDLTCEQDRRNEETRHKRDTDIRSREGWPQIFSERKEVSVSLPSLSFKNWFIHVNRSVLTLGPLPLPHWHGRPIRKTVTSALSSKGTNFEVAAELTVDKQGLMQAHLPQWSTAASNDDDGALEKDQQEPTVNREITCSGCSGETRFLLWNETDKVLAFTTLSIQYNEWKIKE